MIELIAAAAALLGAAAAWAGAMDARRSAAKTESALRLDAIVSVMAAAREVIALRDRIERAVQDYSRAELSVISMRDRGQKAASGLGKLTREMMSTVAPLKANTTEWFKRAKQIVSEEASLRTRELDDLKALEIELKGYLSAMSTNLERLSREVTSATGRVQSMRKNRTK